MALRWGDRILETSTTTGTGAFALAAAVTGYRRFSAIPSIATNDTVYYSIFAVDGNGNPSGDWETGLGTYSAANELTRTTPSASTNGGAAVNFGAGTKYVMATPTAAAVAGFHRPTESLVIAASDETTALTTGTAKVTFRMPYAFTLSAVRSSVTTAPTGSTLVVDINEGGSTILSTKLSIDASEKTSTTAATAAVISDTALADDAEITIDLDQVGATIAGAGLVVTIIGTRA
jgi:hypothetical protein